jgi:hypothetical protein
MVKGLENGTAEWRKIEWQIIVQEKMEAITLFQKEE